LRQLEPALSAEESVIVKGTRMTLKPRSAESKRITPKTLMLSGKSAEKNTLKAQTKSVWWLGEGQQNGVLPILTK
jgi:hypothetical protein